MNEACGRADGELIRHHGHPRDSVREALALDLPTSYLLVREAWNQGS